MPRIVTLPGADGDTKPDDFRSFCDRLSKLHRSSQIDLLACDQSSRERHTMNEEVFSPARGGCACGQVRFIVERAPLYVHCCHCTRCQRETGGPFAHHAVLPWCDLRVEQGEVQFAQVPSDSGTRHWVARCPSCHTALWNEWGSRQAVTRYLRVGTLDEPNRFPPRAHIYLRSRLPWVSTGDVPGFDGYYPADHWPEESRRRWREASALKRLLSGDAPARSAR